MPTMNGSSLKKAIEVTSKMASVYSFQPNRCVGSSMNCNGGFMMMQIQMQMMEMMLMLQMLQSSQSCQPGSFGLGCQGPSTFNEGLASYLGVPGAGLPDIPAYLGTNNN